MCSWCWGISPGLRQLEAHANSKDIPFHIWVGGLRPGGGDAWNAGFKSFLRHHWEEIGARTGQPFTYRLLERASFTYDTEPACRAVVVLRAILQETRAPSSRLYDAFAAIQRKFYAEGEDPTAPSFYESICADIGVTFSAFLPRFEHADARAATTREFREVRGLGVSAFPTVLYRSDAGAKVLASGYATGPQMLAALDSAAKETHR